jgi:hypothetical protein
VAGERRHELAHRHAVDDPRGAARCELRVCRYVGGAADLVLVPRDQHPIAAHHQIRLEVVGAVLEGEKIRRQRVLGDVAARAAMTDDDRKRAHARAYQHTHSRLARLSRCC